jgi:nucleoside 2-deoxyribosyltransferase
LPRGGGQDGGMAPRVYLAGPDVFLPDAEARAAALKAICARHGLAGVSPLDEIAAPAEWAGLAEPFRLYRRNEAHMRGCAAIIANLTPFRGPSADVGTAFEVGFMRALGRPVFAWSTVGEGFAARTLALVGAERGGPGLCDADGMAVEDFGLFDNLMLDGAIAASGGMLALAEGGVARWRDLGPFEACVRAAAERLCAAPP